MSLNPDIMNQQIQDRYRIMQEGPDIPVRVMEDDEGRPMMAPPPLQRTTPDLREETYDEEIFPGGPTKSELASWKKQFNSEVYLTEIGPDVFIWRPLNRFEYKNIVSVPNTDPLMREEMICEACVLFPKGFSIIEMANGKAGVPAVLAEQIMQASGFDRASVPQLL